jgi:hypothetical protein
MNAASRKRVVVFIDHDMTIRHFVKSRAFAELERDFEVTYVVNLDPHPTGQWVNTEPESLGFERLRVVNIPRRRMGEWYKLYAVSLLQKQRGTANYKARKERMATVNGWRRTLTYEALSLPGIFPLYRRRYLERMGEYEPLRRLIEEEKPDLCLYPSMLTGYFMNELMLLCPKLGIPFVVLMNSWDNPSQKAMVTGTPDRLVVWGEHTKRHAMEFMRLAEDRIEVFGAAQFQVYREPVTDSRAELCAMFGVPDDGLPVVLYAGVSKSINETRHLQLLDAAIEAGRVPPCRVLYRPHPWRGELVEGELNFFEAGLKHITMDPWMEEYYRRVVVNPSASFEMADYNITRKLLGLVAGSISTLSTIQLETVLVGKPTISFMPKSDMETKYGKSAAISQRLAHFVDLWTAPGVISVDDDADLPAAVRRLLEEAKDPELAARIRAVGNEFAVLDGPTYGERLNGLVHELAGG